MVKHTIVAFLACSLIILVSPAYAEPVPESLLRLKPSANLRIETSSLKRIDGRLLRATGDTLFLFAQGSEAAMPLRDVRVLWKRGRAVKTGAIVGAVVGAIGLSMLVAAIVSIGESGNPGTGDYVLVGVAGAVGGGLVGGLIGAAIPKWHRRYP